MKQASSAAPTAQHDHIGDKYDKYARTATLQRAESYPSDSRPATPEDVAHYGEAYWLDIHDNNLVIGLVCQK
jgi:hypothetical protein